MTIADTHLLILEDDPNDSDYLRFLLMRMGFKNFLQVASYNEGIEALKTGHINLLLADIELAGEQKTGIDLARFALDHYHIPTVFISSHQDAPTINHLASINPLGYIVKPLDEKNLIVTMTLALGKITHGAFKPKTSTTPENTEQLFVKSGYDLVAIDITALAYIFTSGNYLHLIQVAKETVVIRSSLSAFLEKLPSSNFLRIHKSYMANLQHIQVIKSDKIVMSNSDSLPLSRGIMEELKEKLSFL